VQRTVWHSACRGGQSHQTAGEVIILAGGARYGWWCRPPGLSTVEAVGRAGGRSNAVTSLLRRGPSWTAACCSIRGC